MIIIIFTINAIIININTNIYPLLAINTLAFLHIPIYKAIVVG